MADNFRDDSCSDIDFVIPWVDGSDPEWQKQKAQYSTDGKSEVLDGDEARYRDWGILPYWFRAVEKYAPWVRRIHFITCGQIPKWLNLNHPKLHFVRHEDYIPHKWLPTFSSHPIELNMHRIEGLSEKFVYFNDDVFLNAPVKPEDFFVDGLPCDTAGLASAFICDSGISHIRVSNLEVISKNFDFRKQFRTNFTKWVSFKYGLKILARTALLFPVCYWGASLGMCSLHTAHSFLKSTFTEVWDKAGKECESTSSHRFRDNADVNQYLMEWWQIMSGKFHPRSRKFSARYQFKRPGLEADDILRHKHKVICLNDNEFISHAEFEEAARSVRDAYHQVLPEKSSFEL